MPVMTLEFIARQTCVLLLLTDKHCDNILQALETRCYTAVSGSILDRMIKLTPRKITNILLNALLPDHVRKLMLTECDEVSVMGVVDVLKRCKHIENVDLSHCPLLMVEGLFEMMGLLQLPITHLSMENTGTLEDHMVHMMITHLPHLCSINLAENNKITDEVFLVDPIEQLYREIQYQGEDVYKYRLSSVNVSCCRGITGQAILHLTSLVGPHLKQLDMSWTMIDCSALLYLVGFNCAGATTLLSQHLVVNKSQEEQKNWVKLVTVLTETWSNLQSRYDSLTAANSDVNTTDENDNLIATLAHAAKVEEDEEEDTEDKERDSIVDMIPHVNANTEGDQVTTGLNLCEKDTTSDVDTGSNKIVHEDDSADDMDKAESDIATHHVNMTTGVSDIRRSSIDETYMDIEESCKTKGPVDITAVICDVEDSIDETYDMDKEKLGMTEDLVDMLAGVSDIEHSLNETDVDKKERGLNKDPVDMIAGVSDIEHSIDKIGDMDKAESVIATCHMNMPSVVSDIEHSVDETGDMDKKESDMTKDPVDLIAGVSDIEHSIDEKDNIDKMGRVITKYPVDIPAVICDIEHSIDKTDDMDKEESGMTKYPVDIPDVVNDIGHSMDETIATDSSRIAMHRHLELSHTQLSSCNVKKANTTPAAMKSCSTVPCKHLHCSCLSDVCNNGTSSSQGELSISPYYSLNNNSNINTTINSDTSQQNKQHNSRDQHDNVILPDSISGAQSCHVNAIVPDINIIAELQACPMSISLSDILKPTDYMKDKETVVTNVDNDLTDYHKHGHNSDWNENKVDNLISDIDSIKIDETNKNASICDTVSKKDEMFVESPIDKELESDKDTTVTDSENKVECDTGKTKDDTNNPQDFEYISQVFKPQLQSLDITHIKILDKQIGDECLKQFFLYNMTLKRFIINWKHLDGGLMNSLIPSLQDLQIGHFGECSRLQADGVLALVSGCKKLTHVDLTEVCFFKDAAIRPLLIQSRLTSLSLAGSEVSDSTLQLLADRQSSTLTELNLSWCEDYITERGINAICQKCTNLRVLDVRKCPFSDASLQLLGECCKGITNLCIQSVGDVDEGGFTTLGLFCIARNLKQLCQLDISWNMLESVTNVIDVAISEILASCLHLEQVTLNGNKRITVAPFLPLIADYEQMQQPHSQEHDVLTRSCVYAPNLRILELEYCDMVDENQLLTIVQACKETLAITDYHGLDVMKEYGPKP